MSNQEEEEEEEEMIDCSKRKHIGTIIWIRDTFKISVHKQMCIIAMPTMLIFIFD